MPVVRVNQIATDGSLTVEVDRPVAARVDVGDRIEPPPRPAAAHVVLLGRTTFYQRARASRT